MVNMTAIILAGGRSSRMGCNKALLPLAGVPVIQKLIPEFEQITDKLIVVAAKEHVYDSLGYPIVSDLFPGAGPLAGLHAGLISSLTAWNFVVACDMPFATKGVFHVLAEIAMKEEQDQNDSDKVQAIIPILDGRAQPLLAAYHRSVLPSLELSLLHNELAMNRWTESLRVRYIPGEVLSKVTGISQALLSFNMNRPEDYEQACQLLKEWGEGKQNKEIY